MMGEFNNKVAVISGAASGIGFHACLEFARRGAYVIGVDIGKCDATAQALAEAGGRAEFVQGDVGVEQTWIEVATAAQVQGGCDFLVNIAGFSALEDHLETLTLELWDKIMSVNLKGDWLSIKHLVPGMRSKGEGAIVNMSSATSIMGVPNHGAYSMSKGGVDALTRQAAVEFAADKIRVNAVCPGPVRTPMMATNTEEAMAQIVDAIPLKRIAEPEEVAAIIAFLCSDVARSITGVVLPIDGGLTMAM